MCSTSLTGVCGQDYAMLPEPARISILTVSDRASRGEYADQGGPAAEAWLQRTITSPIEVSRLIVPDGRDTVADALCGFAEESIDLVLVTDGRTAPCASARTSCATSTPARAHSCHARGPGAAQRPALRRHLARRRSFPRKRNCPLRKRPPRPALGPDAICRKPERG